MKYCPKCNKERETEIREEKEIYPVKNEPTEILAKVTYCKHCGEQIWNDELDNNNLQEAYHKYRSVHGLLQPEDIKEIREKYNITQTTFAKILGFGEKTIARYETGSIQDSAQNNLMELANFPNVFEHLLKKSISNISKSDYDKAIEALANLKPTIITGGKSISYKPKHDPYKLNYENLYFGGLSNVKDN